MARSAHRPHLALLGTLAAAVVGGIAWMASGSTPAPLLARHDAAPGAPAAAAAAEPARAPARRAVGGEAVSGPEGAYDAPVGTRMRFDLQARIGAELVRRRGGAAERSAVQLDGALVLTVLDRRDDEAVVEVRLPELAVSSPQARAREARAVLAALATALGRPALARIDTSGRVLGYRFAEGTGYLEKTQLRAVLAGMRFIVVPEAAEQRRWTVLDRDDSGEFEAVYAWRGDGGAERALTRERTRYTAPSVAARGEGELEVTAGGRATALVSEELGWLVGAEFDDSTVVSFDAMAVDVRSTCSGSARLAEHSRIARGELPAVDWDGAWEPVGGDPQAALALADGRALDRWSRELQDVALDDVIAELAALTAAGIDDGEEFRQAWEKLARLFELRPEAAEQVMAWLAPGRLDDAAASGVLTALGCAGTPQAQAALLAIQRNDQLAPPLRGTATIAMVQVQEPTATALGAMLEAARGEVVDGELGRLSLMVLGTVAPRAAGPLADGRPAVDALLALEDRCRAAKTVDAWLHALGNSRVSEVAAHAERYLGDDAECVREAAAAALRSARSPSSERRLIESATEDPSAAVRSRAAESLGEHGTDSARAALRRLASSDAEALVREAAVLALAQHLDAAGRAVLQQVAQNDAESALRELAAELLGRS